MTNNKSLNERAEAWVEKHRGYIDEKIKQAYLAGTQDKMDVKEAVKVLGESLTKDPDLYYAYQANIAMAFVDEFNKESEHHGKISAAFSIHHIANQAAINFLNNLIR